MCFKDIIHRFTCKLYKFGKIFQNWRNNFLKGISTANSSKRFDKTEMFCVHVLMFIVYCLKFLETGVKCSSISFHIKEYT